MSLRVHSALAVAAAAFLLTAVDPTSLAWAEAGRDGGGRGPAHGRPGTLIVRTIASAPALPVAGGRYRIERIHPWPTKGEPIAELVTGRAGATTPLAVKPGDYRVIELNPPPGSTPAGPWLAVVRGRKTVVVRATHPPLGAHPTPAPVTTPSTTTTTTLAPATSSTTLPPSTTSTTAAPSSTTTEPTTTTTTAASVLGTTLDAPGGDTLPRTGAATTALAAIGIGLVITGAAALGARTGRAQAGRRPH